MNIRILTVWSNHCLPALCVNSIS